MAFRKRQKTQKTQTGIDETICFISESCFLAYKNNKQHYETNGFSMFLKACDKKTQTEIDKTLQKQWFRQFQFVFFCSKL